jgi:hypothetical protein
VNVDSYEITFELSKPFRPVEQLLAVLPADSVKALPEACQQLMLNSDSPIIDIYSRDIPIDPNGKILPWLWVVLLPFIDERRIVEALKLCENEMTPEEVQRNSFGNPLMFLHNGHTLGVVSLSHLDYSIQSESSYSFPPVPEIGNGICGLLSVRKDLVEEFGLLTLVRAPIRPLRAFEDIASNRVMCFEYKFPDESDHLSIVLPGVDLGAKVLCDYDGIVARPKLNKGKFNIADIAERMREERTNQSQYPHQRMVLSGLGKSYQALTGAPRDTPYPAYGREESYRNYPPPPSTSYPTPSYRDSYYPPQRDSQYPAPQYKVAPYPPSQYRDAPYPAYGHDERNWDYAEPRRAESESFGARGQTSGFSFRGNFDSRTSERTYSTPNDPRQYPPADPYYRNNPPPDQFRGYPPPMHRPPPAYSPHVHQNPQSRAPPIPQLGHGSYTSRNDYHQHDPRNFGYDHSSIPQQQSLGDLRNQINPGAYHGNSYDPRGPVANPRDPRMRR